MVKDFQRDAISYLTLSAIAYSRSELKNHIPPANIYADAKVVYRMSLVFFMKIATSNANIAGTRVRETRSSCGAMRNITQYVPNINIRVSLMRGTNICIL